MISNQESNKKHARPFHCIFVCCTWCFLFFQDGRLVSSNSLMAYVPMIFLFVCFRLHMPVFINKNQLSNNVYQMYLHAFSSYICALIINFSVPTLLLRLISMIFHLRTRFFRTYQFSFIHFFIHLLSKIYFLYNFSCSFIALVKELLRFHVDSFFLFRTGYRNAQKIFLKWLFNVYQLRACNNDNVIENHESFYYKVNFFTSCAFTLIFIFIITTCQTIFWQNRTNYCIFFCLAI